MGLPMGLKLQEERNSLAGDSLAGDSLAKNSLAKDSLANNFLTKDSLAGIQADSLLQTALQAKKKRRGPVYRFEKFVKRFIDFNDYDTTYISPNKYNFAMMLAHNSTFEHFQLGTDGDNPQTLRFAPRPSYKVGAYFGWRWIFVGFTMDAAEVFGGHNKHSTKKKQFSLNLYSSKLGADFYYWEMGNDFRLKSLSGFTLPESSNESAEESDTRAYSILDRNPIFNTGNSGTKLSSSIDFTGIKAIVKGFNMYYIFNNKHFSYPAAFSQSTNQRKSVGTLLTGISFSSHKMTFDYQSLPEWILNQMDDGLKVHEVDYQDYSIHFGYAYNWVFARNFLACISLTPALAYKRSHLLTDPTEIKNKLYRDLNFDFISRAALVYNDAKYFAGLSWVGHSYTYNRNDLSINNAFGTLQFYAGFNFGKKKKK
jgi:hypothetical protein